MIIGENSLKSMTWLKISYYTISVLGISSQSCYQLFWTNKCVSIFNRAFNYVVIQDTSYVWTSSLCEWDISGSSWGGLE